MATKIGRKKESDQFEANLGQLTEKLLNAEHKKIPKRYFNR